MELRVKEMLEQDQVAGRGGGTLWRSDTADRASKPRDPARYLETPHTPSLHRAIPHTSSSRLCPSPPARARCCPLEAQERSPHNKELVQLHRPVHPLLDRLQPVQLGEI
eukprot:305750-Hanusia_phi.AAC.1